MPGHTIDWDSLHQRLASTTEALAAGRHATPEQERHILEARARQAARSPAASAPEGSIEILAFTLASERYGVETAHVGEVFALTSLTPLPGAPRFLAGVTGRRGRVLAIVDLRVLFDLPPRGLTELNRVIVLRAGAAELGLLADSVEGVRSLREEDLQEAPPTLTGVRERFLHGVDSEMLAVLDGARLLEDDGLKVADERTAR